MKRWTTRIAHIALLLLCLPVTAFAQRELHWDTLSVTAHLNADGSLQIAEAQTIVFSGDWNGGERTFNIRPRQTLSFQSLSRWNGTTWQPMTEDRDLDSVDDFAWTDSKTLRWRSRLPSDPPFNRTPIRYELKYALSGILLKDGDRYTLDHDFAFPDRAGAIDRFELRLTLDPAWQSTTELRDVYTANSLAPGRSFVVTIPLRFVGAGTPAIFDRSRPRAIQIAVLVLLGVTGLAVIWLFVQEQAKGRFTPVDDSGVDAAWLAEHILKYPAELVGSAWDDSVGQAEVVALLARMTSEGKLESHVSGSGKRPGMKLGLKVDRSTLHGYERALVDRLFFDGRTTTSTDEVKAHYHSQGFNPVDVIEKDLEAQRNAAFPFAGASRGTAIETFVVFTFGLVMLGAAWWSGEVNGLAMFLLFLGTIVLGTLATIPGGFFRARMDWGRQAALLCLLPAFTLAGGTAAFLWFYAGSGAIELSGLTLAAITALAIGATNSAINALRSRQKPDGIAFRKRLTAGRLFFMSELRQPQPALRDEWYPWVLAFELGKEMDDWSARSTSARHSGGSTFTASSSPSSSSSSSSSSSPSSWTGFGGGRSGGGGAGASWAAAAGGLAAGVAAPSSSSSGGSGGGGGGGGGSSGGGGGGGW